MALCGGIASIAVIGGSLVTGAGASDYPQDAVDYQPTQHGWVSQLDNASDTVWQVHARNDAVVSDFLPDGRYPELADTVTEIGTLKPGRVYILLGANEYRAGTDPYVEFWDRLDELVKGIQAASGMSRIYLLSPYQLADALNGGDFRQHDYWQAAVNVAALATTKYLNLAHHLPPATDAASGLYVPDELGPGLSLDLTDAGHDRVAQVVASTLPCSLPAPA